MVVQMLVEGPILHSVAVKKKDMALEAMAMAKQVTTYQDIMA